MFPYPYQAIKSGVARQGISPGGLPPHLSSFLQIVRWIFLLLRSSQLRVMSGFQAVLREQGLQVEVWESSEHSVEEIPQIAMGLEHHAGLVVMTARGRDARQQHLLSTISAKFLQHAEVPILLTHV